MRDVPATITAWPVGHSWRMVVPTLNATVEAILVPIATLFVPSGVVVLLVGLVASAGLVTFVGLLTGRLVCTEVTLCD